MTDAEFSNRLDRLIEAFENSLSGMGATINRTAGSLNSTSSALRNTASAASFAERAFEAYTGVTATATNVERIKIRVGEQLAQTLKTLGSSSLRATETLYSTSSGLGTFTKTIEDVNQIFATLGPAITDSVFIGALSKASPFLAGLGIAAQGAGLVLKGFTALVSTQLNLMQAQISSYYEVNRAGAIFGGSLTNMQTAASELGISLPMLGKITSENIEDLSKFGVGLSLSSTVIAEHAVNLVKNDRALTNLYGSTEELAKGTASYIALQSQLGNVEATDIKKNSAGINSFLLRQKELSDITGLRTEQLKQEEQERRKNLAYNTKLARLGDIAQQNVSEGMAVAGKIFGEEGASYAKEFFATGGRVVSRESLIFASMMPEAAAAIQAMVTNVDQSKEDYRKGVGAYFDANKEALQTFARGLEQFAEINFAANNPIITSMTTVASRITENAMLIGTINSVYKSAEEEAKKRIEGLAVISGKTIIDKVGNIISEAEQLRLKNQADIDKSVTENFGKMLSIIQLLGAIQRLQIGITTGLTGIALTATDVVTNAIETISDLTGLSGKDQAEITRILEKEKTNIESRKNSAGTSAPDAAPAANPAAPANGAPPLPTPTPAPAAGPPPAPRVPSPISQLDGNSLNLGVNGTEMLAALNKVASLLELQNKHSEESNRIMADSRAVQERML